ncbi:hypothetical protein IVA79_15160 [Bradyrhizobium sp. 138]|uniref:hypothetical protein n=1 Tax=Bradyrhizobium sp. 138 TaxID=2782615 RepID=UPI001FFA6504|nr:hypothetical protein [Bradyrhizobium sp. 138]MCK1735276.1 hypothetical protein [Bradyrhizobium sp. 138]
MFREPEMLLVGRPSATTDLLDYRFRRILLVALFPYPVLLAFSLLSGCSWEFVGLHAALFCMVVVYFALCKDHSLTLFVATHSFWLFSYSLLMYAVLHQVPPDRYLIDPIRSSLITVVYLCGCICARLLSGHVPIPSSAVRTPASSRVSHALCYLGLLFIPARVVFGSESFWYAISAAFTQLYWLGLYLRFERGRFRFADPLLLAGVALCLIVSVVDNRRALMFELCFTFVLIYLRTSIYPFSPPRILLAAVGSVYFARFSDIFLYARIFVGRERPAELLNFVVGGIFSASFLLAPLGTSDTYIREALESYVSPYSNYRIAMFEGRSGISERATLLPQMDAVVGVLPEPDTVDWGEISNTLLTLLPSFGQDKDQNFGDRLTWRTGLRPAGIVGHPLITAAGEFFAMGGYLVLFAFTVINFLIFFIELKLLIRLLGSQSVAIMFAFNQAFYMMFTSTAISATAVVLRQIPFLVVIYLATKFVVTQGDRGQVR